MWELLASHPVLLNEYCGNFILLWRVYASERQVLSFLYIQLKNCDFMLTVCFCVYCTRGDEGHITRDDMYALMRQALIHVSIFGIAM